MGRYSSSAEVMQRTIGAARAQLDDLQAELEAGARFADKIENEIAVLKGRLTKSEPLMGEILELRLEITQLRVSVREQRELMAQLRQSLDALRRESGNLHKLRRG